MEEDYESESDSDSDSDSDLDSDSDSDSSTDSSVDGGLRRHHEAKRSKEPKVTEVEVKVPASASTSPKFSMDDLTKVIEEAVQAATRKLVGPYGLAPGSFPVLRQPPQAPMFESYAVSSQSRPQFSGRSHPYSQSGGFQQQQSGGFQGGFQQQQQPGSQGGYQQPGDISSHLVSSSEASSDINRPTVVAQTTVGRLLWSRTPRRMRGHLANRKLQ
jgi:hypothetical protein